MSAPDGLDVAFARAQFPALSGEWALFENAGGTVAARFVLERVQSYIGTLHVQPAYEYGPSSEAARRIAESHRLMAEMIGAEPEEVMIGPNTTMNVFLLSHAIRGWFEPGDEIIVTDLDHEANSGAWRRLEEFGLVVKEWRFHPDTAALEPSDLEALLTERTRLVCFTHCSNVTGGVNDVAGITRRAHEAGALVCVDGVAYAPHRALDVKAWDVDFYLCSLYKVYGPHLSLLYAKRAHVERAANNNHYFLADKLPLKLNPGGPNHELTAALAGVTDYFDALHAHHFGQTNLPLHGRIKQISGLMAEHEERIAAPFVDFLRSKPGVRLIGKQTMDKDQRAPTFSFTVEGHSPADLARSLAEHRIGVGHGDFYAARCIESLGLAEQGGVLRASMVHYNSEDDVRRLIDALDAVL